MPRHPAKEPHARGRCFAERGEIRREQGDLAAAAADLQRAVELDRTTHMPAAMECHLLLGDVAAALAVFQRLEESPFNWGTRWFKPVKPDANAHLLALRAVARLLAGDPDVDVDDLLTFYPTHAAAVADKLSAAFGDTGGELATATARVSKALR